MSAANKTHVPRAFVWRRYIPLPIGRDSEFEYLSALSGLNVHILEASNYITLSKTDGIHLDEPEHLILGQAVAKKVIEIDSM